MTMSIPRSTSAILLALLGAACARPADGQDPLGTGELTQETRTVALDGGVELTVDFGRLGVPENREASSTHTIEVAYARVRSTSDTPMRPLFYLAGGPGDAAVWHAREPEVLEDWLPWLEVGDVVFLDQRSAGESTPSLRWRVEELPPLEVFADRELLMDHMADMTRQARADLEERGIDLAGYTTVQNAEDVDDLREALGYGSIALLGFSYGTHLALAYAWLHPERLDAMILSNVEGPDHTLKLPLDMDTQFRRLALAVAADPNVGEDVPDLVALLERVRARLAREPMVVRIQGPGGAGEFDVPVGPVFLDIILRIDIGDASDLPVFPRLLHSIDRGDPSVLRWFVQRRAGLVLGVNGMHEVMNAASGATEGRRRLIEHQAERSLFGNVPNLPPDPITDLWGAPDLGDAFRSPLVSDVRTLLLSGEWDWNTPPYQAEQIRWGLPNATHLHVLGAGHEQVLPHPEIRSAIAAFLRGEDVRDVRAAWPPLRFIPVDGHDPDLTHPSIPRP